VQLTVSLPTQWR